MEGQDVIVQIDLLKKELQRLGCEIREDWFGGKECAICEIRGKQVIFVDLASSPLEVAASLQKVVEEVRGRLSGSQFARRDT